MFKKILVPVDGSEGSWKALETAAELGAKFGAELVVVNVIQPFNNAAFLSIPLEQNLVVQGDANLEKIGDKVLDAAKEKLAGYPGGIKLALEVGHPSERILALSKKEDAECIVIGSRGLSGIAEFFLGSVSSKVSQYANVPVLITK